jgi:hypothetical protein
MGFENPNDAEEFYASPEQVELTYQRLMRALKAGIVFAIIAIILLVAIQPDYWLPIAAALAVFEALSYTFFSKKYTTTRDELLAESQGRAAPTPDADA